MSSKPASEPHPSPTSIAVRLTGWYAAAAFTLVLVASGYLYWGLARNLDREDDQYLADKVDEFRRVLDARPGDRAALEQEVAAGASGRFLARISTPQHTVETPGMTQILQSGVFPRASEPGREHELADGRSFRLRTHLAENRYLIHVAMDTSHDEDFLGEYRRQLGYALVVCLLAAVLGGYWIARRGLRPIAEVTATARRIGPAQLGERIEIARLPAEVRDLAVTFNQMLDRLADAFARLGRFSADIAHELRTPVNNLRGEVEVALGRPRTPDEYRDVLGSCLEEAGKLSRLIDGLLFLARTENPKAGLNRTSVDVGAELAAVREVFAAVAVEAGVRLDVEARPGLVLPADRELIQRTVGNLVANAVSHTPAGGSVVLTAERGPGAVRLRVRDTGSGIAPEHLPHIFDRFYRADAARTSETGRVGLGLAIVRGIVELHGGTATATSDPGRGTTMTLTFPTDAT